MPSTVITALNYDAETHTLTIVYRGDRGTYRYFDVPEEEYIAFRSAQSKGTYLNQTFKSHNYRYERITPPR